MTPQTQQFLNATRQTCTTPTATLSYRVFGAGRPLLLIHGWMLWGFTFRNVIPALSAAHTCCAVDLPGAGDSDWTADNDFSFDGHVRNLIALVDHLGWSSFDILAHDTGATTARFLAHALGERVGKLVLIDTELPHHKPPGVTFAVKMLSLPGSVRAFQWMLRSRAVLRSNLGLGTSFSDLSLIDGDFYDYTIRPLLASRRRVEGQIAYAKGINWARVDDLAQIHPTLPQAVLLVWGDKDPFFPIAHARAMMSQFKDCRGLHVIEGGKLLTHEEFPDQVATAALTFLT
jgi:haloalkane dehalogenase